MDSGCKDGAYIVALRQVDMVGLEAAQEEEVVAGVIVDSAVDFVVEVAVALAEEDLGVVGVVGVEEVAGGAKEVPGDGAVTGIVVVIEVGQVGDVAAEVVEVAAAVVEEAVVEIVVEADQVVAVIDAVVEAVVVAHFEDVVVLVASGVDAFVVVAEVAVHR